MSSLLRNKKAVSILLIVSMVVSFSPLFTLEVEAQAEADKEAGKAKLAALGLSDAEIAALVG